MHIKPAQVTDKVPIEFVYKLSVLWKWTTKVNSDLLKALNCVSNESFRQLIQAEQNQKPPKCYYWLDWVLPAWIGLKIQALVGTNCES